MAPLEESEFFAYCSFGTVIATGAAAVIVAVAAGSITHTVRLSNTVSITGSMTITGTVAIRLPTVDKNHIAASQLIPLSFIDHLSFPILYHKAKVRLKFLTLAVWGLIAIKEPTS